MSRFLFCLFISCIAGSCSFFDGSSKRHIQKAVYMWELGNDGSNDAVLQALQLDKIYVHFADIGWNDVYGAHPIAKNYAAGKGRAGKDWPMEVPVIYFVNDVFAKLDLDDMSGLAYKVKTLLDQRYTMLTEIQIDCDWTESTRDLYFLFLRELKSRIDHTKLSVTLRLYQYKYREKSGVPPADCVMLMLYHTGKTTEISEVNSIFNQDEAEKYVKNQEPYPLPLHAALPYFSWIKLSRNGEFKHLIRSAEWTDPDANDLLRKIGDHTYELLRDTVLDDSYLRLGDHLLFETAALEETLQAARIAREAFNSDTTVVAVFDLKSISRNENMIHKFNSVFNEAE